MRRAVLVTGGARSGKSVLAEQFVAAPIVDYVATSQRNLDDPEWEQRVLLHQARRPSTWRTLETLDIAEVLYRNDPEPVLVDCLAVWLARTFDEVGAWDGADGWVQAFTQRTDELVAAFAATQRHVVAVTNEVGSGIVPGDPGSRLYRDELGRLNARVAQACDEVWLCTVGIGQKLKG